MRKLAILSSFVSLLSVAGRLSPLLAFDPKLVDALVDADAAKRKAAYAAAAALDPADQVNLAPFLSEKLDDPAQGELASLALCRLGNVGVPFLDRRARMDAPGAEYADMGLIMGPPAGQKAMAAILQNGDEAAVVRGLSVVEASAEMPAVVGIEVKRLAEDSNPRFSVPAKSALAAVEKAAKAKTKEAPNKMSEMSLLDDQSAPVEGKTSDDEVLKKLVAELISKGAAGQQALSDQLSSGAIDQTTYDEIQKLMASSSAVPPAEAPGASGTLPTRWTPDGSSFATRQPASDAFGKNR